MTIMITNNLIMLLILYENKHVIKSYLIICIYLYSNLLIVTDYKASNLMI